MNVKIGTDAVAAVANIQDQQLIKETNKATVERALLIYWKGFEAWKAKEDVINPDRITQRDLRDYEIWLTK